MPREQDSVESQLLRRTRSDESIHRAEPRIPYFIVSRPDEADAVSQIDEADDTSVISRSPTSFVVSIVKENDDKDRDNHVDIRGLQLLYLIEF